MTAPMPMTPEDKFRKLLRVSLYKRLDARLLQDTEESSTTSLLFKAADNNYLDPLFLEYLTCLTLESKTTKVSFSTVLDYLAQNDLPSKHLLIIYLSKRLNGLSSLPTNVQENLFSSLANYMAKRDQFSREGFKALGYLLRVLSGKGFCQSNQKHNTSATQFISALKDFVKSVEHIDAELAHELKVAYSGSLEFKDDLAGPEPIKPESSGTLKLSRVFRMLYVDRLFSSSLLIQGDSFYHELDLLFAGENAKVIIEQLITTVFDCLASAMQRQESEKYVSLWNSFIIKRLPLIIQHYAKEIPSSQIDSVVCRPITLLDRTTIALISGGHDALDDMFSSFPSTSIDIRTNFLQACIELKIISPECFKQTLGNEAMNIDTTTGDSYAGTEFIRRKNGDDKNTVFEIFSQFTSRETSDQASLDDSELMHLFNNAYENLDGYRQEIIAIHVLKMIREWSSKSNTQWLSRLCQILSSSPNSLDMLTLHVSPCELLLPLIQVLDDWVEEEEMESNFQDRYLEFGSIFIFILMVYYRYNLQMDDLPILMSRDQSFCKSQLCRYFQMDGLSLFTEELSIDDLPDNQKELVGDWIFALFSGDGISDDLMRMSSVQGLINLIPIIFQQITGACERKIIEADVLRGGLDYFRQPFLAATTVAVFQVLYQTLWESQVLSPSHQIILQELVMPSDRSPEALRLHDSILSFMSKPLHDLIVSTSDATITAFPAGGELIKKATDALSLHISDIRKRSYFSPESSSLVSIIKDHITRLVTWSLSISSGQEGALQSSIDTFVQALNFLGARESVAVILEELDFAENQGIFDVTLDVISSLLVCSERCPTVSLLSADNEADILEIRKSNGNKEPDSLRGYFKLQKLLNELQQRFKESLLHTSNRKSTYQLPPPDLSSTDEFNNGQVTVNGFNDTDADMALGGALDFDLDGSLFGAEMELG